MAILINGNGNKAIWAAQDADLIAAICGNVTSIAAVGNQFAATQEDASTIGLADGVIITKEGRRIQLDTGKVDLFTIPTGTAGVTSYYIIGYKLSQQSDTSQICETFVQKMNSASETIDEDTFKGGATEVYVSCYRVTQDGLNIDTIESLLPLMNNLINGNGGGGVILDFDNKVEVTTTSKTADSDGAFIGTFGTSTPISLQIATPSAPSTWFALYAYSSTAQSEGVQIYGIEKGTKFKLSTANYNSRYLWFVPYK